MQNVYPQIPPDNLPNTFTQQTGNSTSTLRQFRKKENDGKPLTDGDENGATHVARVAPHNHYPPRNNDYYKYHPGYTNYSAQPQVKYSEIAEVAPNCIQHVPEHHLGGVITKNKDVEMTNTRQQAYPVSNGPEMHHQYLAHKDPQMHGFKHESHQYAKESQYHQQFTHMQTKYNIAQNHAGHNDFLAKLQRINPEMARSIMSDHHIRERDLQTTYQMEQSRMYPQNQRYYPTPPNVQNYPTNYPTHRNIPTHYNYQACNYGARPGRYGPIDGPLSPTRRYTDIGYASIGQKISPNYHQSYGNEYAQHYQHRRMVASQEYYQPQLPPQGQYLHHEPQHVPHQIVAPQVENHVQASNAIRQYLENWAEEDINTDNIYKEPQKREIAPPDNQELFVINSSDLPQYLENGAVPLVTNENGQLVIKGMENSGNIIKIMEKNDEQERVLSLHIVEAPQKLDKVLKNNDLQATNPENRGVIQETFKIQHDINTLNMEDLKQDVLKDISEDGSLDNDISAIQTSSPDLENKIKVISNIAILPKLDDTSEQKSPEPCDLTKNATKNIKIEQELPDLSEEPEPIKCKLDNIEKKLVEEENKIVNDLIEKENENNKPKIAEEAEIVEKLKELPNLEQDSPISTPDDQISPNPENITIPQNIKDENQTKALKVENKVPLTESASQNQKNELSALKNDDSPSNENNNLLNNDETLENTPPNIKTLPEIIESTLEISKIDKTPVPEPPQTNEEPPQTDASSPKDQNVKIIETAHSPIRKQARKRRIFSVDDIINTIGRESRRSSLNLTREDFDKIHEDDGNVFAKMNLEVGKIHKSSKKIDENSEKNGDESLNSEEIADKSEVSSNSEETIREIALETANNVKIEEEEIIKSELPLNEELLNEKSTSNIEICSKNEESDNAPISKINEETSEETIPIEIIPDVKIPETLENISLIEEETISEDFAYRSAIKIEENTVLLHIGGELVEINVHTVNGKKIIRVTPLSDTTVVDYNGNSEESLQNDLNIEENAEEHINNIEEEAIIELNKEKVDICEEINEIEEKDSNFEEITLQSEELIIPEIELSQSIDEMLGVHEEIIEESIDITNEEIEENEDSSKELQNEEICPESLPKPEEPLSIGCVIEEINSQKENPCPKSSEEAILPKEAALPAEIKDLQSKTTQIEETCPDIEILTQLSPNNEKITEMPVLQREDVILKEESINPVVKEVVINKIEAIIKTTEPTVSEIALNTEEKPKIEETSLIKNKCTKNEDQSAKINEKNTEEKAIKIEEKAPSIVKKKEIKIHTKAALKAFDSVIKPDSLRFIRKNKKPSDNRPIEIKKKTDAKKSKLKRSKRLKDKQNDLKKGAFKKLIASRRNKTKLNEETPKELKEDDKKLEETKSEVIKEPQVPKKEESAPVITKREETAPIVAKKEAPTTTVAKKEEKAPIICKKEEIKAEPLEKNKKPPKIDLPKVTPKSDHQKSKKRKLSIEEYNSRKRKSSTNEDSTPIPEKKPLLSPNIPKKPPIQIAELPEKEDKTTTMYHGPSFQRVATINSTTLKDPRLKNQKFVKVEVPTPKKVVEKIAPPEKKPELLRKNNRSISLDETIRLGNSSEKRKLSFDSTLNKLEEFRKEGNPLAKKLANFKEKPKTEVKNNNWEEIDLPPPKKEAKTCITDVFSDNFLTVKNNHKIIIDMNDFSSTLTQKKPDDSLQNYKTVVDSKLNSLDLKIPSPAKKKTTEDSLMERFLRREHLTKEEIQRIKEIIYMKKVARQMSLQTSKNDVSYKIEDSFPKNDDEMKLHLKKVDFPEDKSIKRKKKRFRNLYTSTSPDECSDFDGKSASATDLYSVFQRDQNQAGLVPKLIFKRKTDLLQPVVRLERSHSLDFLAKKLHFNQY